MSDASTDPRWQSAVAASWEDVERFSKQAESFQKREARRWKMVSIAATAITVFFAALAFLLGGALYYAVPSIRVQPFWLVARADGTFDTFSHQAALPGSITEAETRAWLWQYVRLRESYNWTDAKDNYDVVSAMSAPVVRTAFQQFWNGQLPNAPSPTKVLGKGGTIRVYHRDSDLTNDTYTARYCRVVQLDGERPVQSPWIVKLRFQRTDTVPMLQRWQFNPNALVVTAYPGPVQQGTGGDASADCMPQRAAQ